MYTENKSHERTGRPILDKIYSAIKVIPGIFPSQVHGKRKFTEETGNPLIPSLSESIEQKNNSPVNFITISPLNIGKNG